MIDKGRQEFRLRRRFFHKCGKIRIIESRRRGIWG
jgi:hypothetical protein